MGLTLMSIILLIVALWHSSSLIVVGCGAYTEKRTECNVKKLCSACWVKVTLSLATFFCFATAAFWSQCDQKTKVGCQKGPKIAIILTVVTSKPNLQYT